MTDNLPDLPKPLNARSAAQYVANYLKVDVSYLSHESSTTGSYSFRGSDGAVHNLHVPIGRRDGVIFSSGGSN